MFLTFGRSFAMASFMPCLFASAAAAAHFDLEGYIAECTTRVPDANYAIPMDMTCVSSARRLCDLASGEQETALCVTRMSHWFETEISRLNGEIGPLPKVDGIDEGGLMAGLLPMPDGDDCTSVTVTAVPVDVVCRYQASLEKWLKYRVWERSYWENPMRPEGGDE